MLKTLYLILLATFRSAPSDLIILILLSIIIGAGPSISLFFSKIVIDELSRLAPYGNLDLLLTLSSHQKLLMSIAIMLTLNIIVDALKPVDNIIFPTLKDGVEGSLKSKVISKVALFNDLALFENPRLLNLLKLAERGIKNISEFMYLIADALSGIFIFLPSVFLSCLISWWIPILLILSSIPSRFINLIYTKKSWMIEEKHAELVRQMDLFAEIVFNESYAKEIRLFSLQYLIIDKWENIYYSFYKKMKHLRWQGAIASFLFSLIEGAGIVIPYMHIISGVINGNYSLGDLALYTGLIFQIRIGIQVILGAANNIYRVILSVSPIFEFLSLEPEIRDGYQSFIAIDNIPVSDRGIKIKDLRFTYPGSDRPILQDINLHIHPGETIAIVGENGSGKTTLSKLLCRLYDPDYGQIFWNGCNLKSFSLNELRSSIAVIMQDYARFPVTLRENVGWGCLSKLTDEEAILNALDRVGMMPLLDNSEQGLDLLLAKQFVTGMDLSGGQWQRVAIARALIRIQQSQLLIFDEPTAAIDPNSEYEIYQVLRDMTQERMSVIVSHRLGLVKIADRIIVMKSGQIVEEGSHSELMNLGMHYYQMFVRQMSYYIDE